MAEEQFTIAAEEQIAITEAMNLLEAEPSSGPVGVAPDFAAPGPDIPALREQLAVLVSTGKAKEAIGVQLTYEQVKRLSTRMLKSTTRGMRPSWEQRRLTA